jgi:hypothetical protein
MRCRFDHSTRERVRSGAEDTEAARALAAKHQRFVILWKRQSLTCFFVCRKCQEYAAVAQSSAMFVARLKDVAIAMLQSASSTPMLAAAAKQRCAKGLFKLLAFAVRNTPTCAHPQI